MLILPKRRSCRSCCGRCRRGLPCQSRAGLVLPSRRLVAPDFQARTTLEIGRPKLLARTLPKVASHKLQALTSPKAALGWPSPVEWGGRFAPWLPAAMPQVIDMSCMPCCDCECSVTIIAGSVSTADCCGGAPTCTYGFWLEIQSAFCYSPITNWVIFRNKNEGGGEEAQEVVPVGSLPYYWEDPDNPTFDDCGLGDPPWDYYVYGYDASNNYVPCTGDGFIFGAQVNRG